MNSVTFTTKFDVSRETLDHLDTYAKLIKKWNPSINLVSKTTIDDIWHRHFLDSAQLFGLTDQNEKTHWVDVGSGGGLPGVVIAIFAKAKEAPIKISLIESDKRKCAFLRTVARELKLDIEILEDRVEALPPLGADIISARAFSQLSNLLEIAVIHGQADVTCLFLKGQNYDAELTMAKKNWHIKVETIPSMTDSSASILKIEDIYRASDK